MSNMNLNFDTKSLGKRRPRLIRSGSRGGPRKQYSMKLQSNESELLLSENLQSSNSEEFAAIFKSLGRVAVSNDCVIIKDSGYLSLPGLGQERRRRKTRTSRRPRLPRSAGPRGPLGPPRLLMYPPDSKIKPDEVSMSRPIDPLSIYLQSNPQSLNCGFD
ncbi:hypothetical protein JTB14_008613 [Gonioctena quinquepunctata]|nr:hypothetical protein JTB14_008613 [Gonioctena quinquepunctata]